MTTIINDISLNENFTREISINRTFERLTSEDLTSKVERTTLSKVFSRLAIKSKDIYNYNDISIANKLYSKVIDLKDKVDDTQDGILWIKKAKEKLEVALNVIKDIQDYISKTNSELKDLIEQREKVLKVLSDLSKDLPQNVSISKKEIPLINSLEDKNLENIIDNIESNLSRLNALNSRYYTNIKLLNMDEGYNRIHDFDTAKDLLQNITDKISQKPESILSAQAYIEPNRVYNLVNT